MEITPTSATAPRQPVTAPEPQEDGEGLSSDFETFLLMLTTQMQNQDPLNPLESSEFAVQLATFSGVEQQVKTNDLLASLLSGLASSGMAQMASWIGREVRTDGPAAFDGTPLTLYPNLGDDGSAASLIVKDATGSVVSRSDLGNSDAVIWAGVGSEGTPLPPGLYRFEVENRSNGTVASTTTVEHYETVSEVRAGPEGSQLVLSGGAEIPAADILSVRDIPES